MTLRRSILALAAVLLVVLPLGGSALGASSFGSNGEVAYVRAAAIQFSSSGTTVAGTDPSWSPNGQSIAFTQAGQIRTCVVNSTCNTPAGPFGAAGSSKPAWSPDGSKIAYVNGGAIHVMDTSGGGDITVASGTDPSWSPDSTQLIFTQGGAIVTANAAASAPVTAVSTGSIVNPSQPAWSTDGTSIAFQSANGGAVNHIYVVTLGTGSPTQVTTGTVNDTAPSWSPDGGSIVYSDAAAGIATVTKIGSSFQQGAPITSTPGDLTPDWQTAAPIAVTPTINGGNSPVTGQLLTVSNNSSWTGAKTFTYQWARCNSGGTGCVNVATTSSYTVTSSDIGSTIRVTVTGTNDAGSTTSPQSNATGVVTQAGTVTPPTNTAYPVVSFGFNQTAPLVGNTLTATNGTWTGTFPMTFTYQWKQCDDKFGSCFTIPNATSSFFTVGAAYYGKVLRVEVTAKNSAGSVSQNSEATPAVTAIAPFLRVTPQITGPRNPVVGQPLSLGAGTWDGSPAPTFTYSWRRCNAPGDIPSCVQIPGATAATYTPVVDDINSTIRVWITGTNVKGSDFGITNHTFTVVDKQHFGPSVTSAPAIIGTVAIGRQLTASQASFSGDDPIVSVMVWQRCDATGAACKTLSKAKKQTYTPTKADIGYTIRLSVNASNPIGKTTVQSDPTEPILAKQPPHKGRHIVGTGKSNYLAGGGYDDTIEGLGGNDTILGGNGADHIDGGAGNDVITGGAGADTILGGKGSDTIYANDGEQDVIDCGAGNDRVVADDVDKVAKNCEMVQTSTTTPTTPTTPTVPTPITPSQPSQP